MRYEFQRATLLPIERRSVAGEAAAGGGERALNSMMVLLLPVVLPRIHGFGSQWKWIAPIRRAEMHARAYLHGRPCARQRAAFSIANVRRSVPRRVMSRWLLRRRVTVR